jgi:SAM-dependent methyltransferase
MTAGKPYIPVLRFHFLTPLFDWFVLRLMRGGRFYREFVDFLALKPGQRVLDIGCGTGTLATMIKARYSKTEVIGVDPDAQALAIATAKAGDAKIKIDFVQGYADALPATDTFEPGSFDCIVSTLTFHHLQREQKRAVLNACAKLLKPEGRLVIGDWGRAANILMRILYFQVQVLDGFSNTTDNIEGRLPEFIRAAGFQSVEEIGAMSTAFGTLSVYRASAPIAQ